MIGNSGLLYARELGEILSFSTNLQIL